MFKRLKDNNVIKIKKVIKVVFILLLLLFFLFMGGKFYLNNLINKKIEIFSIINNNIENNKRFNFENNIYVFKVNNSFSDLSNDKYKAINSILNILVLSENKEKIINNSILDKFNFLYKEENEGYFFNNILIGNNESIYSNIINKTYAAINISNLNEEKKELIIKKGNALLLKNINNSIYSDDYILNSENPIIENNFIEILKNDNTNKNNGKKFYLINNLLLLLDYLENIQNYQNIYLGISNANGYIDFYLYEDKKEIFSTLKKGNILFENISTEYKYKYQSNECEQFTVNKSFFSSSKVCNKYKINDALITLNIKNNDNILDISYYNTSNDSNNNFFIKIFGNSLNIGIGKNSKVILPRRIYSDFKKLKDFIHIYVINGNGIKSEINNLKIN